MPNIRQKTWHTGDSVTAQDMQWFEDHAYDGGGGSGYQLISNLVTTISSSSSDTKYPSAKAVYLFVQSYIAQLDANEVKY